MTSIAQGEAVITLSDGRKLHLAYDYDGLIALEEAAGMKMRAIYAEIQRLEQVGEDPSARLMRAIFFGGLQQHHPEITLKEVGDIIVNDMDALLKAFEAFQGSHGPAVNGGSARDASVDPMMKTRAGRSGTGARSSRAGAAPGSRRKASGARPSGPIRKH